MTIMYSDAQRKNVLNTLEYSEIGLDMLTNSIEYLEETLKNNDVVVWMIEGKGLVIPRDIPHLIEEIQNRRNITIENIIVSPIKFLENRDIYATKGLSITYFSDIQELKQRKGDILTPANSEMTIKFKDKLLDDTYTDKISRFNLIENKLMTVNIDLENRDSEYWLKFTGSNYKTKSINVMTLDELHEFKECNLDEKKDENSDILINKTVDTKNNKNIKSKVKVKVKAEKDKGKIRSSKTKESNKKVSPKNISDKTEAKIKKPLFGKKNAEVPNDANEHLKKHAQKTDNETSMFSEEALEILQRVQDYFKESKK